MGDANKIRIIDEADEAAYLAMAYTSGDTSAVQCLELKADSPEWIVLRHGRELGRIWQEEGNERRGEPNWYAAHSTVTNKIEHHATRADALWWLSDDALMGVPF